MTQILELFGASTKSDANWDAMVRDQRCPFLEQTCLKIRKSNPEVAIGTCAVTHGKERRPMVICPYRLLERSQIFVDCLHLLAAHEPGNALHVVPEVSVPGGSVDYFVTSVRDQRVVDFVGVELQTMDTTGSVWPARQRFLDTASPSEVAEERTPIRRYGMNWKMTAKTILVQLHHKIRTFSAINRHLVLVTQDDLLDYLRTNFDFDHVVEASRADAMHFHSYSFLETDGRYDLRLERRLSTDAEGVAACLGLNAEPEIGLGEIVAQLERKISTATLLRIGGGGSAAGM